MVSFICGETLCKISCFVLSSLLWAVFFRWILARRKLYYLSWKLPGPVGIPFLGNICPKIQSVPKVLKRFEEESKKYASPYRLWVGTKLVVVFTDPEQIKSILTESYIPGKPGMYYYWATAIGTGLLTGHGGGTWRRNRLLWNAAFENFSITNYQNVVNKQVKVMVNKMEKLVGEGTSDIGLNSHRLCFDIVTEALLKEKDTKFQVDNLDHFIKTFHEMSTCAQRRATTCWLRCNYVYFLSTDYGHMAKASIFLRHYADDIYKRRKEEFLISKKNPVQKNDEEAVPKTPIDIMLETQYTGNRPFDHEVVDEILNLYQAGGDLTASNLSFFILMLAIHGDVQDRLYKEISTHFKGKKAQEITVDDLRSLKYLDMCMNEVMRMFPAAAFLARDVTQDVEMDNGLTLPAGTKIVIPSYMLNMTPRHWKDPTVFDPERFSAANSKDRHRFLFLPYGAGPRNCIGQDLGNNIVKTAIIELLTKFCFRTDVLLKDIPLYVDMITMKSENGYPVQVLPRN